jgi:hypothetical protein
MNITPEKLRRLRPFLERLPESVRVMIEERPEDMAKILKLHKEKTGKEFPSIEFIPNIGQERALRCLAKRHESYGDYPHKIYVFGGNMSGKTCSAAAILLAGVCLGPKYVNQTYCNWDYFYECEKIRKNRKLYVRIVCSAADMKENSGSMWQQIKKWIPTAEFKDNQGFYKTVVIGDVIIDVKSFDQSVVDHAGPDYDIIIINEPAPKSIYRENMSRTRGRGRLFNFLTPLDLAAYLYGEIHASAPEGEICWTEMAVWDNCSDIPGNRGCFTRAEIEKQIRDWQSDPDTLDARIFGKFAHLSGTIFKVFGDQHIISPFPIDSQFNIYHICDPHLIKPPFGMWIAKNALNQCFVVAESPQGDWPSIRSHGLTIEHFCKNFTLIEQGRNSEFPYLKNQSRFKIGDPNIMPLKMPNSGRSLKTEYSLYGWEYDTDVCDDTTVGFEALKKLLYWNQQEQYGMTNMPRLFVFKTCPNTIRALREFGIKKLKDQSLGTETQIDKTWECPIACLRYFAMKEEPWAQEYCYPDGGIYGGGDDYAAYLRGMDPHYVQPAACSC